MLTATLHVALYPQSTERARPRHGDDAGTGRGAGQRDIPGVQPRPAPRNRGLQHVDRAGVQGHRPLRAVVWASSTGLLIGWNLVT